MYVCIYDCFYVCLYVCMLEICGRSIADQSASGARQGYGVLSRNAHVTVAQRPSTNQQAVRDKVMESVAQRPRDCRATPT